MNTNYNGSKSKWSMQCKKVVRECGLKAINVIGLDMRDKGWYIRLVDGRGHAGWNSRSWWYHDYF